MIKILLGLICLLALSCSINATTFTAASCSAADFNTQIALATDGDTVQGPASPSSVTWSSTVTITKGIKLDGRGCTVTFSGGGLTIVADVTSSASVTNFTFDGISTGGNFPISVTGTDSPVTLPWRIYNNTFNCGSPSAGAPGTFIGITSNASNVGNGPGLIDHNNFPCTEGFSDEIIHALGNGAGNTPGWTNVVPPGGPNMIFVEYNIFSGNNNGSSAIEGFYGARIVWRNNQMNGIQVDFHGGGGVGTRWWEVYNNTWIQNNVGICVRAGSGIIFNNTEPGGQFRMTQEGGSYPALYQVGRGQNQNLTPAYVWNNTNIPSLNTTAGCAPGTAGLIAFNRDVYANGGNGTTTGLLSAIPGTCSTFQGYFATDQNTLYKCTSTNTFTAYWTPFTNPHPSDNCGTTVGPTTCSGGPPQAATPTFAPVAGTYSSPQTVTISTSSSTAIICYSTTSTTPVTNGTAGCTTGILYSGPVSVTSTETIYAVAGGTGFTDSTIGTAAYVLGPSPTPAMFSGTMISSGTAVMK